MENNAYVDFDGFTEAIIGLQNVVPKLEETLVTINNAVKTLKAGFQTANETVQAELYSECENLATSLSQRIDNVKTAIDEIISNKAEIAEAIGAREELD